MKAIKTISMVVLSALLLVGAAACDTNTQDPEKQPDVGGGTQYTDPDTAVKTCASRAYNA